MGYSKYKSFGNLTLKQKRQKEFSHILNKNSGEIDCLFKEAMKKLDDFSVMEVEQDLALDNLRYLVEILQTKRIREKNIEKLKYFSI